ncbi:MAG: hypothetical protein JXA78_16320 [Anaerolineales bacterium]|nr:hypothetical protein [Anaerolineales bacterium]
MKFALLVALCALCELGLAACLPLLAAPPPLPSATPPAPTETSTATIVWFPPTATYTPLPSATLSLTPTLDTRPSYGELIFADHFDDPARWNLGRLPAGSMALGLDELSLVVARPRGYLFSLRQGAELGDFYAEVTASPSICRAADEYGLLLRVSPALDFFRFGLTCAGQARLDRYLNGVASAPQPPVFSGAVPPGAPSASRLAVWAMGREMRFYANGQYLFSVSDPSLPSGGLGVFARACGEDMLSVSFSNLEVYDVQTPLPK